MTTEAKTFDDKYRSRLDKLSTTNISDAMDKIGLRGTVDRNKTYV